MRRQFAYFRAAHVGDHRRFGNENQLVGVQAQSRRDTATSSIVRLKASPVGEKPSGDSSTSPPVLQDRVDRFVRDLAHDAGQFQIDAIDDAHRTCGDEVAGDDADRSMRHRRVRQALAERGFDIEAQFAGGFLRAFQRGGVGDAHAVVESRLDLPQCQLFRHLRARAVHDHDLDAQRVQQRQILRQDRQCAGSDQFARKGDDERPAAESVNVRRDGTQPLDELNGVFHVEHYNHSNPGFIAGFDSGGRRRSV